MKTQYRNPILLIFTLFLIVGCASHYAPETMRDPYGFFSGLWHGAISGLTISVNIISWLLSLMGINFLQDIQIIGRPNTGFFYISGFGIGFFIFPLFR